MESPAKFCESCGKPVAIEAKFCAACGTELLPGPAPVGTGDLANCPRCGKAGMFPDDALLKIQEFLNRADYSKAELKKKKKYEETALHLVPPEKPRPFSLMQYLFLMCIPVINVLSVFMSPLGKGLKTLVAMIGAVFIGCIVWAANSNKYVDATPHDVTMMVGATFFTVYFLCLVWTWFAEKARVRRDEFPRYKESLARWPHTRYCMECNAIYHAERAPEKK